MTQENLPVISKSTDLLPGAQEFQMFQTIARSAKNSGLYGGDEHKIFMVMLAARELGIPPMLALNGGIWNIQGKIEISARLMNSMIRRAGHHMKIESTATECTIKAKRADNSDEHIETFTWAMAERAGLIKTNRDGSPGLFMKYPEDMLYNRCMSRMARRLFPDVIGTAYVEGELKEAVLQDAQFEDVTPQKKEPLSIDPPQDGPIEDGPISKEQLDELLKLKPLADKAWVDSMEKHMADTLCISGYESLPMSKYNGVMASLRNNIEKSKRMA